MEHTVNFHLAPALSHLGLPAKNCRPGLPGLVIRIALNPSNAPGWRRSAKCDARPLARNGIQEEGCPGDNKALGFRNPTVILSANTGSDGLIEPR